jgi:hypothetical protein
MSDHVQMCKPDERMRFTLEVQAGGRHMPYLLTKRFPAWTEMIWVTAWDHLC